jgi:hypothetical protein
MEQHNQVGAEILVQYLLGSLPEEEAERLDELAVADDEFAWRLKSAEHDLVDAYADGRLFGPTLDRFRTYYLASPARQENVRFAKALSTMLSRSPAPPKAWFALPVLIPRWALACAALILIALGYLAYNSMQILQRPLEGTQVPAASKERPAAPPLAAFVLAPPRRGAGQVTEFVFPRGIDRVAFELQLEDREFPSYQATLRDPASGGAVWRSADLTPHASGDRFVVSIEVPANLFGPRTYHIELASAGPRAEPVANYPFKVTLP